MKNLWSNGCIWACFALIASPLTLAQSRYEPSVALERFSDTFDVNSDGSYREVSEVQFRIETSEGISLFGVERLPYASSREALEVREAWILQPDGSKIIIPPESIRTQEEGAGGGSTDFSDTKYKVIVFPQVRVGSRLYWRTESVVRTPLFKGQFWNSYVMATDLRVDDWQVAINVPAGMSLYIEKRGVDGGLQSGSADSDHYRFAYQRPTFVAPEEVAVSTADYADILQISTLVNAAAVGKLFHEHAASKAAVTEPIRALSEKLTTGLSDEREKARTLYNWVSKNIRYVSVTLGSGGYVPHSAEEVLHNEYGDCKDHTILLEALLRASGIESVPALINAGDSYTLSTVGVSSPLNHVISYLPTLDLYVDSTAKFAPFGTLPFDDSDKPVVLTSLGRIGRTPRIGAKDNLVRTDISIVVQPDGSIDGSSMAAMTGQYELGSRSTRFGDRGVPSDQLVKGILSRFGETGSGAIRIRTPKISARRIGLKVTSTWIRSATCQGAELCECRSALRQATGSTSGEQASRGTGTFLAMRLANSERALHHSVSKERAYH